MQGAPFEKIWINPNRPEKDYSEIYIAPVDTSHLLPPNVWEQATIAEVDKADVRKHIGMMADYVREAFIEQCRNDPNHKFTVVETPGPDTLILELAITQLVPSKVELQALTFAPWWFVAIPATAAPMVAGPATKSEDQGKGEIAIEAIMRDGASGEIVSMFADREHPPTAVIDVKALFSWEPPKPIIEGWARQFVELSNGKWGKEIKEIPNFQILVL